MEEGGLIVKRNRVTGEWVITKPVLTPAIEADFRISSKVRNLYKELRTTRCRGRLARLQHPSVARCRSWFPTFSITRKQRAR